MSTGWRHNIVGLLMLPLSMLPFSAYVTQTAEGHLLWTKATHPLFGPDLPHLSNGEVTSIDEEAPRYSEAAAVLVYHGLGTSVGEEASQTMTPVQFGEQLVALRTAGMNPVTATEFVDACAGGEPLPDNAVMITFDDGRTEAMMHADPLLEQANMTATMFVISGAADTPSLFYAGWSTLEAHHASGRWDLQAHTAALHDTIPADPAGEVQQRPLLVNRLDGETLADWRERVAADLDASSDSLRKHTGSRPVAFAYPFGAYGGDSRSNDPRIEEELREVMSDHVDVAFQQDEQDTVDLADCADDPLMLRRLDVGAWTGPQLVARIAEMARHQQSNEPVVEPSIVSSPPSPAMDPGEPTPSAPPATTPPAGTRPAEPSQPATEPVGTAPGSLAKPRLQLPAVPLPAIPEVLPERLPTPVPPRAPVPVPTVAPLPVPSFEPAPAPPPPVPETGRTPPGQDKKKPDPPGRRR